MLPTLYAVTDVYCTPSVMEGFGMSAQEAAATGIPVVASHLVPFVTEYLLGEGDTQPVKRGKGAVVVRAGDVDGFAYALEMLLTNDELRQEMGKSLPRYSRQRTSKLCPSLNSSDRSGKKSQNPFPMVSARLIPETGTASCSPQPVLVGLTITCRSQQMGGKRNGCALSARATRLE
jgi:hypothetical protein